MKDTDLSARAAQAADPDDPSIRKKGLFMGG